MARSFRAAVGSVWRSTTRSGWAARRSRWGSAAVRPASGPLQPRLLGAVHEGAFSASLPLGVVLGLAAEGPRAKVSAAVFGGAVVAMFGASALYHRFTWSERTRLRLRRLDHAGIFGL